MSDPEKQDKGESEKHHSPKTKLLTESQEDKEKCKCECKPTKDEIPNKLFSWKNRTHTEKTNVILVISGIATVFLLYYLTTEQIEISRNTAKTELRAYLQADSVYFITFRSNEEMVVGVRITNVGQTPAYNFRGLEKPKYGQTIFVAIAMTSMFIGGKNSYLDLWMRTDVFPSKNDSIDISAGIIPLGYNGKFFYDDVFGNPDSFTVCRTYDTKSG